MEMWARFCRASRRLCCLCVRLLLLLFLLLPWWLLLLLLHLHLHISRGLPPQLLSIGVGKRTAGWGEIK